MEDTIIETITLNTSSPINIVFVGMMGKGRGYTLCAGHLEQAIIEYVERSFDIKSVKNKTMEELKTMGSVPQKANTKLKSRYAIGEKVTLDFWLSGKINGCVVDAVHFTEDEVRYDILVPIKETSAPEEYPSYLTLIKNVDSFFVIDID